MQKRFWVVHRKALEELGITAKETIIDLNIESLLDSLEIGLGFFARCQAIQFIKQFLLSLFFELLVEQCDTKGFVHVAGLFVHLHPVVKISTHQWKRLVKSCFLDFEDFIETINGILRVSVLYDCWNVVIFFI